MAAWEAARREGAYVPDTFPDEGFVHLSTAEQWPRVRAERFAGQGGLVLLEIETAGLEPELRWENREGGSELFPHLYAPLPASAVISAQALST
jgi:uncharacterized protein (DUF952 family)